MLVFVRPNSSYVRPKLKVIGQMSCQVKYLFAALLVVPFPVLFKDEKKYAEIVDVLDQLEKWVHQIYALAGKIPPEKDISNAHHVTLPSLPSTSQPDQPLSNVHPVADPNDPLAKVRVPCYGDQLTRVRIAGAKDLRAGCHTAKDQISHIYPIKCADWHCKRSFLKVMHALHLNCYIMRQGNSLLN